jgi:hypothetical protein
MAGTRNGDYVSGFNRRRGSPTAGVPGRYSMPPAHSSMRPGGGKSK